MGPPTRALTDYYILGPKVGTPGGYGYAQLVTLLSTGEKRIAKVIAKGDARKNQQLAHEYFIQCQLDHKNIIKTYECFEDAQKFYIIMQYCAGGELFARIEKRNRNVRYTEREAAFILRQIVEGVQYLHNEHKIAHCDLKPDNFLFLGSGDGDLKVIDFGMSRHYAARARMNSKVGTPYYMAPEIHRQTYTYHCDMWSIGVVMFLLHFGFPPFHGNDREIERKIQAGFDPVVKPGYGPWFPAVIPVSAEAKDLMKKLLEMDPAVRISATEALSHPWLRNPDNNNNVNLANVIENLKHFRTQSRLKHVVLRALVEGGLDEGESARLQAAFSLLDAKNDGFIDESEFKEAQANSNNLTQDAKDLLRTIADMAIDLSTGDRVLYVELVEAEVAKKLSLKEDRLDNLFKIIDFDNDGKLTANDIKLAFGNFLQPDDDVNFLIREVDRNHDGFIDYEEFVALFIAPRDVLDEKKAQ
jgi:calcium-dependent protein kinase